MGSDFAETESPDAEGGQEIDAGGTVAAWKK